MSLIEFKGVKKAFSGKPVLKGMNLAVEKGRATLVTLGVDGRTPVIP